MLEIWHHKELMHLNNLKEIALEMVSNWCDENTTGQILNDHFWPKADIGWNI